LRFLSHAETLRVFQRACVRAGVQIAYSRGFNPHQRMSLVLPRSVGVESDDELLCLWLKEGRTGIDAEPLKAALPAGIEIISVKTSEAKNIPEPISARYVMKVRGQSVDDGTRRKISEIMASDKFIIERRTGDPRRFASPASASLDASRGRPKRSGGGETKPVDIRPFLETIKAEPGEVTVDCKISPAGTIRVDEILSLLQLKTVDLAGPVRRTDVKWKGT